MIGSMGPYRKLVRWMSHRRLVAAATRGFGWRLDRRVYRASGGRFSLLGTDVLLLTTTGRRSGRPRETPIIFIRDGERLVISSEDFGQRRAAGWRLNLEANPEATVLIGRSSRPYLARRLSEPEADTYWQRLVDACPAHATYWKRNGRRHVYVLSPVAE